MALAIEDLGIDNQVELEGASRHSISGLLRLSGSRNHVSIGENCQGANIRIVLGDDCRFSAGAGCALGSLSVEAGSGCRIALGDGAAFTWYTGVYMPEPSALTIGAGSLFASETLIFTSDMHSILDLGTGRRINPARDIVLGNSVWVGQRATLLKGITIGSGSVIGLGSVVSKDIPANSLAAGMPAAVVRTNVAWRHDLI